uniref:DAC domain-containing protein n=1 Tax=Ditylenchus dipsaci TaxID=166011 RepID=A0A915EL15_9BILA
MDNEKLSYFILHFVSALMDLSYNGISALMIIDPQKGDENFFASLEKNAVILNADFNSYLLYAIFNESTPFHDLAVIVRLYPAISKVTIHAASVELPMADEEEVVREFGKMTIGRKGARHRAAIGGSKLFEHAFIIMASHGTVHVCAGGEKFSLLKKAVPVNSSNFRNGCWPN